MSAGEIAGLIAAIAFVLLVGAVAVPLLKLGRTIDELTATVRLIREEPVAKSSLTMDETNTLLAGVNDQVRKVDAMTADATTVTGNAAALSSVVASMLGLPLVRMAAFSYGVRRALSSDGRTAVQRAVRREAEARRERAGGRRARRGAA